MSDLAYEFKAGATSKSINVFVQASSTYNTTGAGLIGLAFNTTSLVAYYSFSGAAATSTQITLATLSTVTSAWASGGFKEIDQAFMPGWYRLDLPNAVLAAGNGTSVNVNIQGASGMVPARVTINLVGYDPTDGVRLGLTALPNTTAGASNGLVINGTNSGSITTGAVTFGGAFTVSGNLSVGAGVTITQSSSNTPGLSVTGNGTAAGILSTGGSTGHGASFVGGGPGGAGLSLTGANASGANAAGAGLSVVGGTASTSSGGTSGVGIKVTGGAGAASTNGAASGLTVTAGGTITVAGNSGAVITGSGAFHGLDLESGAGLSGDGLHCVSNAASAGGNGIYCGGLGTGNGLQVVGGGNGVGLSCVGGTSSAAASFTGGGANSSPAGAGILITGGFGFNSQAAGPGLSVTGGASSVSAGATASPGIKVTGGAGSTSNNGAAEGLTIAAGGTTTVSGANGLSVTGTGNLAGLALTGAGTGPGLKATGGLTGAALSLVGGSTSGAGLTVATTSGDGIQVTPTAGNALVLTANGTSKHGLVATGGTAGTSDGIKGVAGTGGVDVRGNITGNLTGNVTGSVGSVTAGVNVTQQAGVTLTAPPVITSTVNDVSPAAGSFKGASGLSSTDDFYDGCMLVFTTGTLAGIARKVTAFTGATRLFTFSGSTGATDAPFPAAPANGDSFDLIGRGA